MSSLPDEVSKAITELVASYKNPPVEKKEKALGC